MKTVAKLMVIFSIFSLSCSQECECGEPTDIWFKVSNEQGSGNYGKVLQLDMSKGYADSDGISLYLFVKDSNGDGIVIMFPFGYWETEKISKDPFLEELEKEFKSLEEYLKKNKGKGTEIKKTN